MLKKGTLFPREFARWDAVPGGVLRKRVDRWQERFLFSITKVSWSRGISGLIFSHQE
jgi:hypothetical protein